MKLSKIESLRYNKQQNKWESCSKTMIQKQNSYPKDIKVGCYNVLFFTKNWFIELFTQSKVRYSYQINKIYPEENFDIICLCETTPYYHQLLKNNEFIQDNYYLNIDQARMEMSYFNHTTMILSKYPMISYTNAISLIILDQKNINSGLIVISIHLSAYEHNANKRMLELKNYVQCLHQFYQSEGEADEYFEFFKQAYNNSNILMAGDFNLHYPIETKIIQEQSFIDLFLETKIIENSNKELLNLYHQKYVKGYSWDAQTNNISKVILPFDNRRMRLDRIILKQNSALINSVSQVELFADQKIFPKKKWSYIMSSDHYGLKVVLKLNSFQNQASMNLNKYQTKNKAEIDASDKNLYKTGFRSITTIRNLRILCGCGIALAIILGIILLI